jgi:ribosomal-protein-alanine N-acetyltransferase
MARVVGSGEPGEDVSIIACRQGDLPFVYEIEKASFPHPYDLSIFQAYMTRVKFDRFDGFLVATRGTEVVGYIIFEYGRAGLVVSMAVRPDQRRMKVGHRLLKEALERLSRRCKGVELQVAVSNLGAQKLYDAFGFSVVRRLPNYYPDGEDAYQMAKS